MKRSLVFVALLILVSLSFTDNLSAQMPRYKDWYYNYLYTNWGSQPIGHQTGKFPKICLNERANVYVAANVIFPDSSLSLMKFNILLNPINIYKIQIVDQSGMRIFFEFSDIEWDRVRNVYVILGIVNRFPANGSYGLLTLDNNFNLVTFFEIQAPINYPQYKMELEIQDDFYAITGHSGPAVPGFLDVFNVQTTNINRKTIPYGCFSDVAFNGSEIYAVGYHVDSTNAIFILRTNTQNTINEVFEYTSPVVYAISDKSMSCAYNRADNYLYITSDLYGNQSHIITKAQVTNLNQPLDYMLYSCIQTNLLEESVKDILISNDVLWVSGWYWEGSSGYTTGNGFEGVYNTDLNIIMHQKYINSASSSPTGIVQIPQLGTLFNNRATGYPSSIGVYVDMNYNTAFTNEGLYITDKEDYLSSNCIPQKIKFNQQPGQMLPNPLNIVLSPQSQHHYNYKIKMNTLKYDHSPICPEDMIANFHKANFDASSFVTNISNTNESLVFDDIYNGSMLKIYDLHANEVIAGMVTNGNADIQSLNNGVYIAVVIDKDGNISQYKFSIVK